MGELFRNDRVTGSEVLLRSLLIEGVECIFGYPGGSILNIYDAILDIPEFKSILVRHEQGAIHAADGYARATGKVGVCFATSGPGATNLVTGIATANMDSVPLVVITGNVSSSLLGTDAFQEADIVGITMPITKHSYLVRDIEELPRIIHEAFYIASTGRRGPVLIDITKDVTSKLTTFQYSLDTPQIRGYKPDIQPDSNQIDKLLKAIEQAERPVILAGAGVIYSDASKELLAFVEKTRIPVTTTLLGLGGFPSGHELWMGMPGMHGTYTANTALQNCDLLISIGARFDDRVTMKTSGFAPKAKTIAHIDIDPAEISKILSTAIPCIGDVKAVLQQANLTAAPAKSELWLEQIKDNKNSFPLRYTDSDVTLKPQFVIEMISESTGGEAIITTDVGQHQMWAAQFYKYMHPRSIITSGGLGTMGFGLPSAIGAQIGNPNRLVVSVNGDGGIQMCAQELAVCALYNLPVKIVILNNQVLGMIRQWQELIYDNRFSSMNLSGSPDFVKLAEAYGVRGFRATNKEEAIEVWNKALEIDGPVVIDFTISQEENVYPMVTPGSTIDEMIMGDEA
ncbi:biosynthetic-type acetolactate synthase large subunit [Paenibacillus sp. ATY16]|uniref:biosynthetic-type acetolactate synthase large subunit n=1 Tax=Paenibacillus sp. ATY16 TaxID=1759312 RepID=UPI00200D5128|nr:biosynthetic-type acetolactate synthase large subunit [Paenibacillus sp. ATY16]MCK9861027.1 biosynthetic-type acetolactate synthase large subunit [Paenibacillus sp. ATY16]